MDLDWEKNLGSTDRMIRTLIGLALFGLASANALTGWWATAAVIFAIFQFIEAAFAY